jgi:cell division protein FtsW (lipid II flippase)
MFQSLRRVRLTEIQLLITALIFFAVGYVLVVATGQNRELINEATVESIADLLWPSSLPFFIFLLVSAGLSWRSPAADQLLLPLVALLSGMGLLLTARLEPSLNTLYGDTYTGIAAKQSLWVSIGVLLLVLMVFVDWDQIFIRIQHMGMMDWLKQHRWTWMVIGLGLMVATFVFGTDPNGSGVKVWFDFGPFSFQPSELLKIILVIFLASYLDQHREVVQSAGYRVGPITLPPLPYLMPMAGIWLVTMGLIFKQSDLGAGLLLFGVFLAMLYVATGKGWYVAVSLVAFMIGSIVLYQAVGKVEERVEGWLDPWNASTGYQLVQGMYALSAGSILGTGFGQGIPAIVPAIHTDFAYTAVGEELGLAGTLGLLIAFLLMIYRGYHIAMSVPGRFRGFEQLLAVGLTSILAIQTFIIIGGNLRVIPLTGITLPFVS